ncbi:MAG: CapA family protein [Acidimicrobiia bacterium]|nr:CapA family protein [Acidimicrobiia bacterium]
MATGTNKIDGRTAALSALAVALMVALVVAWRIDAEATSTPPERPYTLNVVDEDGMPVEGATVAYGDSTFVTGADGSIEVKLRSPQLAIVDAPEMLSDAIVIGTVGRPETTIGLLAATGPGGDRTVMHFAGDVMMGRRYVETEDGTEPLVSDRGTARAVVDSIAPLFGLADLSTVNFESVIGTLSPDDAYPGKRYLLQSPPESIAALQELGVDVVTLGNNHSNDWLEAGLASTIRNLDAAGMPHVGAGSSPEEAIRPVLVNAAGVRVGMISMTTVTGDYVNDSLPDATAPEPATLAEPDRWQYEARSFGFGAENDAAYVPTSDRRPGTMWRLYREMEDRLGVSDAADLWQDMVRVYPELQDWVARRGHGGAGHYARAAVADAVAAARAAGADLVVVQLHGGYQFADVGSDYFGRATRGAVDAGADLVIGHHPHVLQGFEIYEGKLIAYSLGNFVFDQDFLATHPSLVLRVVFEGSQVVATTLYPVILDGYRPVAASGEVADRILTRVNEASLQNAESLRLPDRRIGSTPTDAPVTAMVVADQGRGTIVPIVPADRSDASLTADVPTELNTLVQIGAHTSGLMIGRDIFGYGNLEDHQSDGIHEGGLEWSLPEESLAIDPTSPAGEWVVRLDRTSQHVSDLVARTAARVSLPRHRWFDTEGAPLDGSATHSVRVWGKRIGAGIPFVRVFFYEFDDTDPTRAPQSTPLATADVELPLVNDGEWHELWVDLPGSPEGANTALVGVGLSPPESQSGTVWIDGLQVVEWREADEIPAGVWVNAAYVMAKDTETRTLTVAP